MILWLKMMIVGIFIYLFRNHKLFAASLVFLFTTLLSISSLQIDRDDRGGKKITVDDVFPVEEEDKPAEKWQENPEAGTIESYLLLLNEYNDIADHLWNFIDQIAINENVLRKKLDKFRLDWDSLHTKTLQKWNEEESNQPKSWYIGVNPNRQSQVSLHDTITELYENKIDMVVHFNQILSFLSMRNEYVWVNEEGLLEFEYDFDQEIYQQLSEKYNNLVRNEAALLENIDRLGL